MLRHFKWLKQETCNLEGKGSDKIRGNKEICVQKLRAKAKKIIGFYFYFIMVVQQTDISSRKFLGKYSAFSILKISSELQLQKFVWQY